MIIIRTLNSEYSIKAQGDRFLVTKTATLPHGNGESRVIADGESRLTKKLDLLVGQPALFDTWHTSTVLEVREA